jgi:hypothetical protein
MVLFAAQGPGVDFRIMKNLKPQFVAYLQANPGFHASGDLQRMQWRDHRGKLASPSNITRRLREMVNEGILLVEHRKNHAYSAAKAKAPPKFRYEQLPNGAVLEVAVQ